MPTTSQLKQFIVNELGLSGELSREIKDVDSMGVLSAINGNLPGTIVEVGKEENNEAIVITYVDKNGVEKNQRCRINYVYDIENTKRIIENSKIILAQNQPLFNAAKKLDPMTTPKNFIKTRNEVEVELNSSPPSTYILRKSSRENEIALSYKRGNQIVHAAFDLTAEGQKEAKILIDTLQKEQVNTFIQMHRDSAYDIQPSNKPGHIEVTYELSGKQVRTYNLNKAPDRTAAEDRFNELKQMRDATAKLTSIYSEIAETLKLDKSPPNGKILIEKSNDQFNIFIIDKDNKNPIKTPISLTRDDIKKIASGEMKPINDAFQKIKSNDKLFELAKKIAPDLTKENFQNSAQYPGTTQTSIGISSIPNNIVIHCAASKFHVNEKTDAKLLSQYKDFLASKPGAYLAKKEGENTIITFQCPSPKGTTIERAIFDSNGKLSDSSRKLRITTLKELTKQLDQIKNPGLMQKFSKPKNIIEEVEHKKKDHYDIPRKSSLK